MKEITLNGAKFKVAANTMDELKNEALGDINGEIYKFLAEFNASEPDIFILDGFATKENLELKDGSNVVFIRRGAMPGREVLKAMIASRNSPELNAALASGCVGVAGLGGLGANIALSCAKKLSKMIGAAFETAKIPVAFALKNMLQINRSMPLISTRFRALKLL